MMMDGDGYDDAIDVDMHDDEISWSLIFGGFTLVEGRDDVSNFINSGRDCIGPV